jgi:pre-mRNA-processing factor 19
MGGKDGKINVRDLSIEDNSSTLLFTTTKAHTKVVSSLIWGATPSAPQGITPGIFFSGGVDSTVKVWGIQENSKHKFSAATLHDFSDLHEDEVSGLSVHASGRYLASCSKDSSWALTDVEKGTVISKNACADVEGGFTALHFHPDGLILGAGGNDSKIRIFDVKTQSTAITFEGHVGAVSSMNFSENGYYLASSSLGEEIVRVWDLRKCACLAEIPIELSSKSTPGKKKVGETKVGKVEFNYSGSYLGVAVGSEIRVFANKTWKELVNLRSTSGEVSGFKFGKDCRNVISCGYDGKLIVYGKTE